MKIDVAKIRTNFETSKRFGEKCALRLKIVSLRSGNIKEVAKCLTLCEVNKIGDFWHSVTKGSLSGFGRNRAKCLVVSNLLSTFADECET